MSATVDIDRIQRRDGRSVWVGMVAIVLVAVAGVMPGFTLGALAVPIETGLHLGTTVFGLVLACFFAVSAAASFGTRRLVRHLPIWMTLVAVGVLSGGSLLLTSVAGGPVLLAVLMVVAGFSNALVQPAAGKFIAAEVPPQRLSLATGLVGAALGAAPLIPGLLVTLVAVPSGWRAATTVGGVIALLTLLLAPLTRTGARTVAGAQAAGPVRQQARPANRAAYSTLWLWSLAAGFGTVGVNVAASFFVQIGTSSGLSTSLAGALLSVASVVAVAMRIVIGALADRAPRRNPAAVAAMMVSGAVGLAIIAFATPVAFIVGAVLAVAGGWGWTGLLLGASMRLLPDDAPRAGAAMQIGLFSGAAIAPLAFGALVSALGVPPTIYIAAACSLLGAVIIVVGLAVARASGAVDPTPTPAP